MSQRKIILDTETTGLDPKKGDRVIEIGCIELIGSQFTHNNYHTYLNPERSIDKGAQAIHGITIEFLQDKPLFTTIAAEFLAYIEGAELIVHNAPFDIGFLDHELSLLKKYTKNRIAQYAKVFDTLALARKMYPGQRNNLDALCKRFKVDNTNRELHGALLDAKLLAEVYLRMTGGQQSLFDNDWADAMQHNTIEKQNNATKQKSSAQRQPLKVIRANQEEQIAHQNYLKKIQQKTGRQSQWTENNE